jgi:hypothetical protein
MWDAVHMTRSDAEHEAERLRAEHPERATHHFFAREADDGTWHVARVAIPDQLRRPELKETIEARPQPMPADDPRAGLERRAPGVSGGI